MSRLKLYWPENDQAETTTYPSRFSEGVSGDNMVIPMRNFRAERSRAAPFCEAPVAFCMSAMMTRSPG